MYKGLTLTKSSSITSACLQERNRKLCTLRRERNRKACALGPWLSCREHLSCSYSSVVLAFGSIPSITHLWALRLIDLIACRPSGSAASAAAPLRQPPRRSMSPRQASRPATPAPGPEARAGSDREGPYWGSRDVPASQQPLPMRAPRLARCSLAAPVLQLTTNGSKELPPRSPQVRVRRPSHLPPPPLPVAAARQGVRLTRPHAVDHSPAQLRSVLPPGLGLPVAAAAAAVVAAALPCPQLPRAPCGEHAAPHAIVRPAGAPTAGRVQSDRRIVRSRGKEPGTRRRSAGYEAPVAVTVAASMMLPRPWTTPKGERHAR